VPDAFQPVAAGAHDDRRLLLSLGAVAQAGQVIGEDLKSVLNAKRQAPQRIREGGPPAIDLSRINFEVLAQRFKKSKHKNTDLEALKAAIRARIEKIVRLNRTRADFAVKFEALIESYNAGSRNIEQLFEELLNCPETWTRRRCATSARNSRWRSW
jgi:hypothetical protein